MADIQIFNNPQFGEVRVATTENGEPLFCAKDVAKALGYTDTADAVSRHCKSGKKGVSPTRKRNWRRKYGLYYRKGCV